MAATAPTDQQSRAATLSPVARLSVDSEVGTLRRVILHRPDLELKRLTPSNKDALLFDDVLWVKRARQEHDAFADALAERGVEVLRLYDLLAETLAQPVARRDVLDGTLATVQLGRRLGGALSDWLAELPGATRPAGSTAASRSTRWPSRHGAARRCTWGDLPPPPDLCRRRARDVERGPRRPGRAGGR